MGARSVAANSVAGTGPSALSHYSTGQGLAELTAKHNGDGDGDGAAKGAPPRRAAPPVRLASSRRRERAPPCFVPRCLRSGNEAARTSLPNRAPGWLHARHRATRSLWGRGAAAGWSHGPNGPPAAREQP